MSVTYSADKSNIQGQESLNNVPTTDDVFGGSKSAGKPGEFTTCAVGVFDTADTFVTSGVTLETGPQFVVTFSQTDPRAEAYKGSISGHISYRYLNIGMRVTTI